MDWTYIVKSNTDANMQGLVFSDIVLQKLICFHLKQPKKIM